MSVPEPKAWIHPGQNCWRIERAERFRVILDAAEYFATVREAMLSARHSIMLIGWDFDARLELGGPSEGEGPAPLGDFVLWLADRTPGLEVRLLRWDTGALKTLFRGNTLWTVLRWKAHPQITLRLDAAHPFAGSHHQKIVVIDDCLAFCGGIDMTASRWDTPEHLDNDPRRVSPGGVAHGPWHDMATVFDGAAARAMGALARDRWQRASGDLLPPVQSGPALWPPSLEPQLRDVDLAIARTIPKMSGVPPVHEVEALWLDCIVRAERFIYVESQYFASRKIAHALAERLVGEDPPEVVVVMPDGAEGWLEPLAMDTARARLMEALQRLDHAGRLRIYHPCTAAGAPIYVHAKVMIVDDQHLRVGSSNLNNRSMRLDSEADVMISADLTAGAALPAALENLRTALMAEHLGVAPERVAETFAQTGSLIATIEALRGRGRSLVPYEIPELSDLGSWLAENEILDPNGPDEIFESPGRRGLFKGWSGLRRRFHQTRLRVNQRRRARKASGQLPNDGEG